MTRQHKAAAPIAAAIAPGAPSAPRAQCARSAAAPRPARAALPSHVTCDACGQMVERGRLKAHQKTQGCHYAAEIVRVAAVGGVRMAHDTYEFLRALGVTRISIHGESPGMYEGLTHASRSVYHGYQLTYSWHAKGAGVETAARVYDEFRAEVTTRPLPDPMLRVFIRDHVLKLTDEGLAIAAMLDVSTVHAREAAIELIQATVGDAWLNEPWQPRRRRAYFRARDMQPYSRRQLWLPGMEPKL